MRFVPASRCERVQGLRPHGRRAALKRGVRDGMRCGAMVDAMDCQAGFSHLKTHTKRDQGSCRFWQYEYVSPLPAHRKRSDHWDMSSTSMVLLAQGSWTCWLALFARLDLICPPPRRSLAGTLGGPPENRRGTGRAEAPLDPTPALIHRRAVETMQSCNPSLSSSALAPPSTKWAMAGVLVAR